IAAALVAMLMLPWVVRGVLTYGLLDPMGLRRHDDVVAGQPLTGAITHQLVADSLTTLLHSFWGQFGWMGVLLDSRIYSALAGLTALAGLGILLWLAPWGGFWSQADRKSLGLLAFAVATVFVLTLIYNVTYLQPQGRYLFPAMAGIAVWAVGGLRE